MSLLVRIICSHLVTSAPLLWKTRRPCVGAGLACGTSRAHVLARRCPLCESAFSVLAHTPPRGGWTPCLLSLTCAHFYTPAPPHPQSLSFPLCCPNLVLNCPSGHIHHCLFNPPSLVGSSSSIFGRCRGPRGFWEPHPCPWLSVCCIPAVFIGSCEFSA